MLQTRLLCCSCYFRRINYRIFFGLVIVTMFLEESESLIFRSPTFPSYDGINRQTASNNATRDRTRLRNFLGQQKMENSRKVSGLIPLSVTDEYEKQRGAKSFGTIAASMRSNNGIRVALFLTLFGVMASKCALPSTFALLVADDSTLIYPETEAGLTHSQQMSRVLTLSTVCVFVQWCNTSFLHS